LEAGSRSSASTLSRPRRIAYVRLFEAANILTAPSFIKRTKALYRSRMKILTDGAQHYRTACSFLSLDTTHTA
jgi:transposase-like protein